MSEPPIEPDPPTPPPRNGCLTALAILGGIVLLLPGICAIILIGVTPGTLAKDDLPFLLFMLALGVGGIALIWAAVRRRR